MKTFRYKVPRHVTGVPSTKPIIAKEEEVLVGVLQGKTVPADEERWYKGAMKTGKVRTIYVQFDIGARGLPGYRTLDSLIKTDFGWHAIEVDGAAFVHRGDAKKAIDRLHDLQRLDGLRRLGIDPRNGIQHIPDTHLQNQPDADRKAKEIL